MWPKTNRQLALRADDPGAREPFRILAQALDEEGELIAVDASPKLARIEISGALVGEKSFFGEFFGGQTSYEQIQAAIQAADASVADTTLVVMRSPGGDTVGMGETAAALRNASNRTAVFARKAFSAAYGIASGADVIAMPGDGVTGGLSAFVAQRDLSKAAEMAGEKIIISSPDKGKGSGFMGAPITAEAIAEADSLAVKLKAQFAEIIASGPRGLDLKDLEPLMKNQTFTAAEALEAGLVDQVHDTEAEFIASLFPTNEPEDATMADPKSAAPGQAAAPPEPAAAVVSTPPKEPATNPAVPPSWAADLIAAVKTTADQVATNAKHIAALGTVAAETADEKLLKKIEATGCPNPSHELAVCKSLAAELRKEHLTQLAANAAGVKAFEGYMDEDVGGTYETTNAAGDTIVVDRSGGTGEPASRVDQTDARCDQEAVAFANKSHAEGTKEWKSAHKSEYERLSVLAAREAS